MKTIGAAKFKELCLALLEKLGPEGLIITKHGKPIARVIPIESECGLLIGSLKTKIRVKGDLMNTGVKWNAQP
ncbi:MAG: type II toxin-antitoxin system Phd/YefM family antitoxin [Deltaproteobacteria bacterium]|nr:type II toxin-antitoxin system Phd/YefM family antitoxin [Deltaproteobacteria bacterium]MBI3293365.1 type II toxin-antitoxin system Phd/YefM family antitoxin [Deltaproteobacteria bacterium]